jgi:hypothetical protein
MGVVGPFFIPCAALEAMLVVVFYRSAARDRNKSASAGK